MGTVSHIKGSATNPDVVLEKSKGEFGSVLVVGWDNDGLLDARASLNLEAKDILWLIESFKENLLNEVYSE